MCIASGTLINIGVSQAAWSSGVVLNWSGDRLDVWHCGHCSVCCCSGINCSGQVDWMLSCIYSPCCIKPGHHWHQSELSMKIKGHPAWLYVRLLTATWVIICTWNDIQGFVKDFDLYLSVRISDLIYLFLPFWLLFLLEHVALPE